MGSIRVPWIQDSVFLLAVSSAFSLDQISKAVIRNELLPGQSVPAQGFFRLTLTSNTGSAFGFFPDQTMLLIIASLVAIGVLVLVYRSHEVPSPILRLSLGMQLGGALGNLVDRVRMGKVTDFIDVGPWPIFNLADSSIVVGILLLVFLFISSSSEKKTASPAGPAPVDLGPVASSKAAGSGFWNHGDGWAADDNYRNQNPGVRMMCSLCSSEMSYTGGAWMCSGCGVSRYAGMLDGRNDD